MGLIKTACHLLIVFLPLFSSKVAYGEENSEIISNKFHYKDQFYHNLTGLINKALVGGKSSYHLKTALQSSTHIFYETDNLISDIGKIIPIIELLHKLKPEGSNPQIMLSLRYVNQTSGHFHGKRLGDMYYDLKSNLSLNDREIMGNHVTAITLDFLSNEYDDNNFYVGSKYATDVSFPSYVKNFLKLRFGNKTIPVGVIYGEKQMQADASFVKRQISSAGFVALCVEFNSFNDFPMFMEQFDSHLKNKSNANHQFAQNLTVTLLIKIIDDKKPKSNVLYPYFSSGEWSTLNHIMSATAHYNSISKLFLKKTYNKSLNMFATVASRWATLRRYDIIISRSNKNFTNETTTLGKKDLERFPFIIPSLQIDEVHANICETMSNLTNWRSHYHTMMVNEKTWRTLARFQQDLEDKTTTCNNKTSITSGSTSHLNVILKFPSGIADSWQELEKHMKNLVYHSPIISQMTLKTLVYDETDIKGSPEIQTFLNTSKLNNLTTGCSLSFDRIVRAFSNSGSSRLLTMNKFRETLEKELCQPLFSSVNTFVWRVANNDNSDRTQFRKSGLFSKYSDLFFIREIFMKEFPGKNVLVNFEGQEDKRILSEMFEAPIVVLPSQMHF